jgi:hypothetical protein
MKWQSVSLFSIGLVAGAWSLAGCGASAPAPIAPAKLAAAVKTGGVATRRNVKTAIDPDASKIDLSPKDTTVEDIVAQKGPPDGKLEGRYPPFETQTWRVKATLASVRLMKDGDYYLVMKGNKGGETVVEVPDPKDCTNSPLEPQITAARKELEDRYHPTPTVQDIHDGATVTGVGFLGFGSANKGAGKGPKKGGKERSGPRLMPGLNFEFDKKS